LDVSDKQQSSGTARRGNAGAQAQAVLMKDRFDPAAHQMDEEAVREAYRRWAPVYDYTFGKVSTAGRRHAVEIINGSQGKVLEVGVGTGLSLPDYKPHLEITGIDLAPEMLDKARARVKSEGLKNVAGLYEMDAGNLQFPDNSFDTVVAMYVITVVPDPEKVMRELARVAKPGGQVMLVNHFSQDDGMRGWVERRMAPFADLVGWHSVFDASRVMICDDLKLVDRRSLRPWGIFTMMQFHKDPSLGKRQLAAE
jgi:phosphatidylethanolamine/phosphatidyl-N-methylethanolamine N-methyltransferase